MRKSLLVAVVAFASASPVLAQAQIPPAAIPVGPWSVEVSSTGAGSFDRCIMSRTTPDGLEVRIGRDQAGLSLSLMSQDWRLEDGARYAVTFAAGQTTWNAQVAATPRAVSVALSDPTFIEALRAAFVLEVRGAGATFTVPLDGSSAALARLDDCYQRNSVATTTNPFVAPVRAP